MLNSLLESPSTILVFIGAQDFQNRIAARQLPTPIEKSIDRRGNKYFPKVVEKINSTKIATQNRSQHPNPTTPQSHLKQPKRPGFTACRVSPWVPMAYNVLQICVADASPVSSPDCPSRDFCSSPDSPSRDPIPPCALLS